MDWDTLSRFADIIGIVSFVITLLTFLIARRVSKKVVHLKEIDDFHSQRQMIIDRLNGFISSITEDHLHKSDSSGTLALNIRLTLTDVETRYTHLSKRVRKNIKQLRSLLENPNSDWHKVGELLVTLKNNIAKEI